MARNFRWHLQLGVDFDFSRGHCSIDFADWLPWTWGQRHPIAACFRQWTVGPISVVIADDPAAAVI
jgi:hypothetical protein